MDNKQRQKHYWMKLRKDITGSELEFSEPLDSQV